LPYIDIESLDSLVLSHKALLIEWGQKKKESIEFKTNQDQGLDPKINYSCQIIFQNKCIAKAKASSKKKAEEKAAKIAVRVLKIKQRIE
jgi:ribonuclease-3